MDMLTEEDIVMDIPKRPAWNYSLSKQELERNEEKYFRVSMSPSAFSVNTIVMWNIWIL